MQVKDLRFEFMSASRIAAMLSFANADLARFRLASGGCLRIVAETKEASAYLPASVVSYIFITCKLSTT